MVNFTKDQLSVAQQVWNVLQSFGYSQSAGAGVIGNLYAESALDPNVTEHSGGGGYGLAQWTPKTNLYNQADACGISHDFAETPTGQAQIIAQGDRTGQWLNSANTAYHTSVKANMTLSEFKKVEDVRTATANFTAHWERPSVEYAHMDVRLDAAASIYSELKKTNIKGEITMQCIYWRANSTLTKNDAFYFDGTKVHYLGNKDNITVLQQVYKDNNGKEMPVYFWTGADTRGWATRLEESLK